MNYQIQSIPSQFFRIAFLSFLGLSLILSFLVPRVQAAQMTLEWDLNTEPDLAGYRIYYGVESGNYLYSIDVGNQTSYTIPNLEPNQVHYVAATAYDIDNNESDFSDEIVYLVPGENAPPVADAGPDQSVDEGITVTLNGSNSTDPNNDIVAYAWEQVSGPAVELLAPGDSTTTFTAPDIGVDGLSLTFLLTVTDNSGLNSQGTCIVNVSWVNLPPTASAGEDQMVDEGDLITLSAFASSDPDDGIAYYVWEQVGGPSVDLSDPGDIQPTFTTLDLETDDVSLTFQLTVEDYGGLRATDTCVVNVLWDNSPPVAQAGEDQIVNEGEMVNLDGSSSWDPDDGIVSIRWTQTSGSPVTLSAPTAAKTTFTAPTDGVESDPMTFRISVTDKGGLTSQDTCIVTLAVATVYEDAEDGRTYGWSVYDNNPRRARIRNKFDDQRQSRVIQLKGAGTRNGYVLRNEDGSPWHNSEQFTVQWSMKYKEDFVVYLDVETTAGHRYIYYTPDNYNDLGSGEYVHHGLGSLATDGQWHTFTRNLEADLEDAQPGVTLLEVNGFLVRGSGKVDDVKLTTLLY